MDAIDVNFDFYCESGERDPDRHSPTLRRYRKQIWGKRLPNGNVFELTEADENRLHHKSEMGEFMLSSDSIAHTYSKWKRESVARIIRAIAPDEIDEFFRVASTIGGYIVFPATQVDGMHTINAERGINPHIADRFDLTLECIRLFYSKKPSPLADVLGRYAPFFELFVDFQGYVNFFLLQDLVGADYSTIKFFMPFAGFDKPALPQNVNEYQVYKRSVIEFVISRNQRILKAHQS